MNPIRQRGYGSQLSEIQCCSNSHIQVRVSNVPPMLWTTTHTSHVSRETRTTVPSSSIGSIEATKRHNGKTILSIVIVALAESAPTQQRTHWWLNNLQQYSASRSHIPGNVSSNRTFQRLNDSAPPRADQCHRPPTERAQAPGVGERELLRPIARKSEVSCET